VSAKILTHLGFVCPGTAPSTSAAIGITANGLIPSQSPTQSGSTPEPTIPFGPHPRETPKRSESWRLGPKNGPKSPRF
jgi:hypothetical protein